jgi:hypothetical protein
MATQVLPDVDSRPEGTDVGHRRTKLFHYVRKNKIAESAVLGNLVQACAARPSRSRAQARLPVCPDCKKIYERLRDESD